MIDFALEQISQRHLDEPTDNLHVKRAVLNGTAVDMESRTVKGTIAVAQADLDNEVVLPNFDRSYFPDRVKTVYFGHQYDAMPIGKCVSMAQRGDSLFATTYITKAPSGIGDDVLVMMDEGVINGFSIGFIPIQFGPPTEAEVKAYGEVDTVVRYSKLLEYSITPMPCNDGAVSRIDSLVESKSIRPSSALWCFPDRVEWKRGQKTRSEQIVIVDEDGDAYVVTK